MFTFTTIFLLHEHVSINVLNRSITDSINKVQVQTGYQLQHKKNSSAGQLTMLSCSSLTSPTHSVSITGAFKVTQTITPPAIKGEGLSTQQVSRMLCQLAMAPRAKPIKLQYAIARR